MPKISDRMERVLDKSERILDAVDPAKVKKVVDDSAVISGNFKEVSADLKPIAEVSRGLVKNLAIMAKRGAALTEKTVRTFLQAEGVRIFFSKPSRELRGKINAASTK